MFLKQSTSQVVRYGPCLDITDGVTEETALTLAQADMRLSKDGGAFAQKNTTGNATHDSDGWYSTTLDATDTATVGELILNVHQPANMLPVWMRFFVVEEAVYDDFFAASAGGYLKPTVAARTLDVTATGAAGIDWGNVENKTTVNDLTQTDIQLADTVTTLTNLPSIPANWITAAGITAAALNGKGDWNVGKTGYSLTQTFPTNFADMSITVTTGLVDITQTAADKVWGTAARILTASTNFNDISTAEVNTQVDTALTDIHLDHLLAVDYDPASPPGTTTALFNELIESNAGVSRYTAAALAQAPTGGSAPTVAQIADGVWDELLAGHVVSDSAGELLNDWQNGGRLDLILDARMAEASITTAGGAVSTVTTLTNLPAITSNWLTAVGINAGALNGKGDWNIGKTGYSLTVAPLTAVQVNAEVDTALADIHLDHLLAVDYDPATPPGVSTALFNELIESNAGVSRYTAAALAEAPTGGSAPTVAQIADGVWDELLAGHVISDSTGELLNEWQNGGRLDLILDARMAEASITTSGGAVTTVTTSTNLTNLPTIPANWLTAAGINAAALNGKGDWNIGKTGYTVSTVSDKTGYALSTAGIDAVWETTLTEAYAADGVAGTGAQILYIMQQFMLDSDISGTAYTIRKLDGTTQAAVLTLDSSTTPTDKNRTA